MRIKKAFTLAEVLITLGIIGIVAALTIPSMMANYKKHVVETRLQKFYSSINQAIKLAEVEYGDKQLWYQRIYGVNSEGVSYQKIWFEKYLAKNLKTMKIVGESSGAVRVYFPDGTCLVMVNPSDWVFYTENPDTCSRFSGKVGRCAFYFAYYPIGDDGAFKYHFNQGVEPYKYGWDGTEEMLLTQSGRGCNKDASDPAYCTALIQLNGWKIPSDYMRKF